MELNREKDERYFNELESLSKMINSDRNFLKGTREYHILYEACVKATAYDQYKKSVYETNNEYKCKYEALKEILKELINNATK